MIVIEDPSSTSERSQLKSPSSPVTARYDSPNGTNVQQLNNGLPPYTGEDAPLNPTSGPSSPHSPHHLQPPHPHGTTHHHHHHHHSHPRNDITYEEHKVIQQRSRYRFVTAFLAAWLVLVIWSAIIRGFTVIIATQRKGVTNVEVLCASTGDIRRPDLGERPAIRWPHPYQSPPIITPCGVADPANDNLVSERLLSIAYPPRQNSPS